MILETKLQPPSLKPLTLRRERLLKLPKNNLERKLVLITGDAGYGKTTLLAQVMKEEDFPCVYYAMDRGDSDLVVFASYLVHGLEKIQPGLASRVKGLLEQGAEVGRNYELLFGTLINELVEKRKEELFFILDDYHALPEDSLVHQALDYFIDHLPDIVHVILASRTAPPLPSMAKWRAKEDLFELSRVGLRFTEEEVKALLSEVYKLVLSEEEVKKVSEQTEGWITGIRLILHTAGKDGRTVRETLNGYLEANQPLFEYFANEIVSQEPLPIQDFLRKSAILEVMTPEACDKIYHQEGSGEVLKGLEKRNLFVSQIGRGEYKFHRLFREYLVSQIKDEGFRKALHLRAADFYQRKEQWEQAIEHYLEAGSYEWAGRVMGQVADEMIDHARFDTLKGWFKRTPPEVFEKHPRLLVAQGRLCMGEGDFAKAEENYTRAGRQSKMINDDLILVDSRYGLGSLLWTQGKYEEALSYLRKALRSCPASEQKMINQILNTMGLVCLGLGNLKKSKAYLLRSKRGYKSLSDFHGLLTAGSNLYMLLFQQGETRLAFGLYKKLIERIGEQYSLGRGILFSNAARVALDLGEVEEAERLLNRGRVLCSPYDDALSRAALDRGYGTLYLQKAKWDQAEEHFDKALKEYQQLGLARGAFHTALDLGRLYRYRGDLEKANETLGLARRQTDRREASSEVALKFEEGFLKINQGVIGEAQSAVKTGLKSARSSAWKTGEFLGDLAYAAIALAKGSTKGARCHLRQAIRLSKLKGYAGILLRELHSSPLLLELARTFTSEKAYLSALGLEVIPEPSVKVQLFGPFELLVEGTSKTSLLRRRMTRAILAYFLLHPKESVTWEEIASWAWPDSSPSTAHDMVRHAFVEIRRSAVALKALILYREGRYLLNSDHESRIWVDARMFPNLLEQAFTSGEEVAKAGYLEKAVALYQGPLLQGFYYSWTDNLRNALEELYTKALVALSELYAKRGDYEKSIACCLKYLGVDDLNEDIHRRLIANYIQLGQKSKALRRFEQLRKILRNNFHTEPSSETYSLIGALR